MRVIEYVKIDKLVLYETNPNKHPKRQIELLSKSLSGFGFVIPILIDEKNVVLAGEGRLLAARAAKFAEAPCIRVEGLTDEQKKALVIADNKLAMNSKWDVKLLKEELRELYNGGFDILNIGFDMNMLQKTIDDLPDVSPEEGILKELDQASSTEPEAAVVSKIKKCPKCGFEFMPQ